MNDLATAAVDAVMQIATAGRDKVRTQRRFFAVINDSELIGLLARTGARKPVYAPDSSEDWMFASALEGTALVMRI
jgi:hypothetical protein